MKVPEKTPFRRHVLSRFLWFVAIVALVFAAFETNNGMTLSAQDDSAAEKVLNEPPADKVDEPRSPVSRDDFGGDLEGAQSLARAVVGNRKLLEQLRPNMADCLAIGADLQSAIMLYKRADDMFQRIPPNGLEPKDGETDIWARAHKVDDLIHTKIQPFDYDQARADISNGDLERVDPSEDAVEIWRQRLNPDQVLYVFWYAVPEEEPKTRLESLFHVNGHWVIIPKLRGPLDDPDSRIVPEEFLLGLLKTGRTADAYAMFSPRVQREIELAEFEQLLGSFFLTQARSIDWQEPTSRVNPFGIYTYERSGELEYENGAVSDLVVRMTDEGEGLRFVHLENRALAGMHPDFAHAPGDELCLKMGRHTIICFQNVIAGGEEKFPAFERLLTQNLKEQLSYEQFQIEFQSSYLPVENLGWLNNDDAEYVLTRRPYVMNDQLFINVAVQSASAQRRTEFKITIVDEEDNLRMRALEVLQTQHFNPETPTETPDQATCQQLASDSIKQFFAGIETGDFSAFLRNCSDLLQKKYTNDDLLNAFESVSEADLDYSTMGTELEVTEIGFEGGGTLDLQTAEELPDGQVARFSLSYVYESDGQWRLIAISVEID